MRNMMIATAMAVVVASTSFAGPFGLFNRRSYNNGGNTTTYASNNSGARFPVANAFLGSAQGVANYLASLGRIGHYGGNPYAFEGVGMGVSPDQALRNCCNNGGVVADYGVCQGANGMWYACKRYHGR